MLEICFKYVKRGMLLALLPAGETVGIGDVNRLAQECSG